MTELSRTQTERARDLYESYSNRVQKHEELYKNGQVGEELTTFFSGLAEKYKKIGILQIHVQEVADARASFSVAAENYIASAEEYGPELSTVSTLSLLNAIFAGALAGTDELVESSVKQVIETHSDSEVDTDHEYADRFYLTGCLADAITGDVRPETYSRLEKVNSTKSGSDAIYGRAILEFTDGIQSTSIDAVSEAIWSMIEYYHHKRSEENIVDLILAPEATALLILAQYLGFDVTISNEFISSPLVKSSVSEMT